MSDSPQEAFQLAAAVAERYEAQFVPAFFAQWAPRLLDAAGVGQGQRVLDVACGTGIVARLAADRVGAAGSVVGLDLNEATIEVDSTPLGDWLDPVARERVLSDCRDAISPWLVESGVKCFPFQCNLVTARC